MDDALILKILTAIPADQTITIKNIPVDGLTDGMLEELRQAGFLYCDLLQMQLSNPQYKRTVAGSEWIRNYQNQQRTEAHQHSIEATQRTANFYIKWTFWVALAGLCMSVIALICSRCLF